MELPHWIGANWFALVLTGSLLSGLVLLSVAIFWDGRARRVANLIRLTEQHRNLWERLYCEPQVARILDPRANISKKPITGEEEMFVIFIILHLNTTYQAIRSGFFQKPRGLRKDVQNFFSLPLPRAVWEKVKELQDEPFVRFMESCLPSNV